MASQFLLESHASTWHDGNVSLLKPDGQIVALASERVGERRKHDMYSKPAYEFLRSRYESDGCAFGGSGDRYVDTTCAGLIPSNHHLYHAAGAFYASGFDSAALLIVDGQGPQDDKCMCNSIWRADEGGLALIEAPHACEGTFNPHSLGHFYTAIAALSGFENLYSEGKVMGLASYGDPTKYLSFFERYLHPSEKGYEVDPTLVQAVFDRTLGPNFYGWRTEFPDTRLWWTEFDRIRRVPIRQPAEEFTQVDMDIAAAGQRLLADSMVCLARRAMELAGSNNLCLAGGVSLNCAANERIIDVP